MSNGAYQYRRCIKDEHKSHTLFTCFREKYQMPLLLGNQTGLQARIHEKGFIVDETLAVTNNYKPRPEM